MPDAATVKLLYDYGPWALLTVAGAAVVALYRRLEASHLRELALAERVFAAVEALKDLAAVIRSESARKR